MSGLATMARVCDPSATKPCVTAGTMPDSSNDMGADQAEQAREEADGDGEGAVSGPAGPQGESTLETLRTDLQASAA